MAADLDRTTPVTRTLMRERHRVWPGNAQLVLCLLSLFSMAVGVRASDEDPLDDADIAALRQEFLAKARAEGENADLVLPLDRAATEDPNRGHYAVGTLARAVAQTVGTKVTLDLQPGAVHFILLGPPDLWHNMPEFTKPGQLASELARRRWRAQKITEFERFAPEFGRRFFTTNVAFTASTETHPSIFSPGALQSIAVARFPRNGTTTLEGVMVHIIRIMNAMSDDQRKAFQIGHLKDGTNRNGTIHLTTVPQGSQDAAWYYQSYVSVTVSANANDPSHLEFRGERVSRRRKGAQGWSPDRTTAVSTVESNKLVVWLAEAIEASSPDSKP